MFSRPGVDGAVRLQSAGPRRVRENSVIHGDPRDTAVEVFVQVSDSRTTNVQVQNMLPIQPGLQANSSVAPRADAQKQCFRRTAASRANPALSTFVSASRRVHTDTSTQEQCARVG